MAAKQPPPPVRNLDPAQNIRPRDPSSGRRPFPPARGANDHRAGSTGSPSVERGCADPRGKAVTLEFTAAVDAFLESRHGRPRRSRRTQFSGLPSRNRERPILYAALVFGRRRDRGGAGSRRIRRWPRSPAGSRGWEADPLCLLHSHGGSRRRSRGPSRRPPDRPRARNPNTRLPLGCHHNSAASRACGARRVVVGSLPLVQKRCSNGGKADPNDGVTLPMGREAPATSRCSRALPPRHGRAGRSAVGDRRPRRALYAILNWSRTARRAAVWLLEPRPPIPTWCSPRNGETPLQCSRRRAWGRRAWPEAMVRHGARHRAAGAPTAGHPTRWPS